MGHVSVTSEEFKNVMDKRSQPLLGLVSYLLKCESSENIMTRPLLGVLLSQSMQLEELLDAYDARNNCQWCIFRSLMAAFKSFSDVSYELLHIEHSAGAYHLLPIKRNFEHATQQALEFTGNVILQTAARTITEAQKLHLTIPAYIDCGQIYKEDLPPGQVAS
jgi:hypothetical protein